jgi:hypothetical protein
MDTSGANKSNVPAQASGTKVAILLVGMHRSGTSALARTLNLLGCDLPETATGDSVNWESKAVWGLNDEVLASIGSTWHDWEPLGTGWHLNPTINQFRERAAALLQSEFGCSGLIVLKDPRLCRLLNFWIEVIKDFSATPVIISPIRSPLEVAASLKARDGIDPFVGQLIWLRHVLDAEAASRNLARAFVRYDDLLSNCQSVTDRLAEILGISWPRRSRLAAMQIQTFISPARRHHRSDDLEALGGALSPWVKSTFEILARWARGDAHETDLDNLDQIKSVFDDSAALFSGAVLAGRRRVQRSRSLAEYADELDAAQTARDTQVKELVAKLTARDAQVKELMAKLSRRDIQVNELVLKLTARDTEVNELMAKLRGRDTKVSALEVKLTDSDTYLSELGAKLAKQRRTMLSLQGSTSWRLTAPLRWVSRSIRWTSETLFGKNKRSLN